LFGNPLLILIAVFIFFATSGEAGYVQAREYTRGFLSSHAMITSFQSLNPLSTVDDAVALLLRTTQQELPVLDGSGILRGVVTRDNLIAALKERGGATPVIDIMTREVPTVPENACLDRVFQQLRSAGTRFVGVTDWRQRLVGYITPETFAELVMIQSARSVRWGSRVGAVDNQQSARDSSR
jgi:stage IV sporulation protein FB